MADLRIDMAYLILAWEDESQDTAYYLDKETGAVELVQKDLLDLNDLTDEIERNSERYLYIPKPYAGQLVQDLIDFINTVSDPQLKRLLSVAIESPNALYSCKTVLSKDPSELERWEAYRTDLVRKRIEKWLAANFIGHDENLQDFSPDTAPDQPQNFSPT